MAELDTLALFVPLRVNHYGGGFFTDSYMPLVLCGLKDAFSSLQMISMVAPSRGEPPAGMVRVDPEIFDLQAISPVSNGMELYMRALSTHAVELYRLFHREAHKWAAMIVIEAGIASQVAFVMCGLFRVPRFVWVGGDAWQATLARLKFKSRWTKGVRVLAAYENRLAMRKLISHGSGAIAAGHELAERLKEFNTHVYQYLATTITADQIETELPDIRHGAVGGSLNILTVGRVTPTKGLEYLLDAIAQLNRNGLPTMLRIAGPLSESQYEAALRRRIADTGLHGSVELIGAVSHGAELDQLYRRADVFAMPSISEGTPKVIPEAMAKGLPIVASRVGALDRLVTDGREGFLVRAAASEELAEALAVLARDPELRYRMGCAAIARAADLTLAEQIGGVGRWVRTRVAQLNGSSSRQRRIAG
jgi:glycosyltransferase involved in cell wall biosynthesis